MNDDDRDDDGPVGYGRPPRKSQFKKGQSGNAKGRPTERARRAAAILRSQSQSDDILRAELNEEVTIRDTKGTRKLTKQALVVKAQVKKAVSGSPTAQRDVIKQARELEERDAERLRMAEEAAAKRYDLGVRFRTRRIEEWEQAAAIGQEPQDLWPHPDDIILYPEVNAWTIRGPGSNSDVPFYEWIRTLREQMFWSMMEQFVEKGSVTGLCSSYALGMQMLDGMLPKRWQAGDKLADCADICVYLELDDIRSRKREWQRTVNLQRILLGLPADDKEIRNATAKIMKPLLKPYGYRSLAHFERAWKKDGKNMKWTNFD